MFVSGVVVLFQCCLTASPFHDSAVPEANQVLWVSSGEQSCVGGAVKAIV